MFVIPIPFQTKQMCYSGSIVTSYKMLQNTLDTNPLLVLQFGCFQKMCKCATGVETRNSHEVPCPHRHMDHKIQATRTKTHHSSVKNPLKQHKKQTQETRNF